MNQKKKAESYWDYGLKIVQVLLLFAAIYQLIFLNKQIGDTRKQQSAQFVMDFHKQLRGKDGYRQLIIDIANDDTALFAKHDTAEVDSYLVLWEVLASINQNKLVDADELYASFSYDIQKTLECRAIKKYIQAVRFEEHDSTLYTGIEHLGGRPH